MVHLYEAFIEPAKTLKPKSDPAQQAQVQPDVSKPGQQAETEAKMQQQQQQQQGYAIASAEVEALRERFRKSSQTERPQKSPFVPVIVDMQEQQRPQHTAVQLRQQQMQSRDL